MTKNKQIGFSLIELLVVTAIIVVMTGFAGGSYAKYRTFEKVRSSALGIQGMIMKSQSMAKSTSEKDVLGYQIEINENRAKLWKIMIPSDIQPDELKPGGVTNYSREEMDTNTISYGQDVSLDFFGFIDENNRRKNQLQTITAMVPSGKLIFDNKEPDLNQPSRFQNRNLYNYLSTNPWQRGKNRALVELSVDKSNQKFSRQIIIQGATGMTEILGD